MQETSIIITSSGPVKGKLNNFDDFQYYSYQGIPYAENPTGKLRFMPPVPKRPWSYVLDATRERSVCVQIPSVFEIDDMSEDCLNINVYVPVTIRNKLLPVMVFVHGGSLLSLSGRTDSYYGPQWFLKRNVIVVTMNYRLGPFGFLSLEIQEAPGNAGLKDVLLSLKWVKQNIKNFGGNDDKVTIAGHSAGALIINYLILTKQSNSLFQQAILFSGSAFTPRSFAKYPKENARALAEELGINTENESKIVKHLQYIDAFDIMNAYQNMSLSFNSPIRRFAPFMPSIEKESPDAVVTENPLEIFRKHDKIEHPIPVIVGITTEEGLSFTQHMQGKIEKLEKLRENVENCIPSNIEYPLGSRRSKELGRAISKLYFDGEAMNNVTITKLTEFVSDTQYVFGVYYWTKQYSRMAIRKELYFYIFDFIGDLNWSQHEFGSKFNKATHSDDMPYLFFMNEMKDSVARADKKSLQITKTTMDILHNFINFGNPTPACFKDLKWPEYGNDQNYLLLNENRYEEKFQKNPLYKKMQFWENVYDNYYNYIDNGGEIEKKLIP